MSSGETRRSLLSRRDTSPNETCPKAGIICTQNVQGLSGKDKKLDSLIDPIVDLMITKGIMAYCIQCTCIVGNGSKLVRDHMMFRHNREEREIGSKGRIPGGVAIILALAALESWKKATNHDST